MRRFLFISAVLYAAWILITAGCAKAPGQREFDTGVFELKRGNYVRAKTYFEKSIAQRPGSVENAPAFNYVGIACWKLGQIQAAMDAFEDSRRLSPELVDPVYNLGVLHAEGGDAGRAVDLLQEAARMDPQDARPLEYLGDFYAKRRQWPDARRSLFAALERSPQSARILTSIALVDLETEGADRATASLLRALEKNSRYAPALFNLGVIHQARLRQPDQAEPYFRKFLTIEGGGPRAEYARAALGEAKAAPADSASAAAPAPEPAPAPAPRGSVIDELLAEAGRLADKGQGAQALDRCIEAAVIASRQKLPDMQEKALRHAARVCFDQPRAHYELGRFLLEKEQAEAALKSFKQAIVLNREYSAAYVGMAQAATQTGEFDAALVGLKQAVKADPKNPDALWSLALLYDEKLDLREQAVKTYEEFARKFGNDPRGSVARDRSGGKKTPPPSEPPRPAPEPPPRQAEAPDRPPQAVVETAAPAPAPRALPYKKPDRRNSSAAVQAFNQGTTHRQRREWDRAIYYYLRSLENDDSIASTFYNLGICYSVQGDYDLAKSAYTRALELKPDQVDARYNLAIVCQNLNEPNAAIQHLRDVIKARPSHAPAHYAIGTLYAQREPTQPLAKQHYQRFLQLAPNDPAAPAVKQWIARN